MVYNDFFVGEGADVTIVAGCGIHNCGDCDSEHDGIHTFYIGKNAKVHYIEKHYGEGEGTGKRILNPQTIVYLEEGASIVMDTSQIGGVDDTKRYTKCEANGANSEVQINEKLLTAGDQHAVSAHALSPGLSRRSSPRRSSTRAYRATPPASAMCRATRSSWARQRCAPSPKFPATTSTRRLCMKPPSARSRASSC